MKQVKQAILWGVIALLTVLLVSVIPLYVDWLWFCDLKYAQVFTTILASKALLALVTGILFFIIVWANAAYALRSSTGRLELYTVSPNLPLFIDRIVRRGVEFVVLFGAIILSILMALEAATHWQSWITYHNYVPFGQSDPVFGIDIGFYVFKLDFLQFAWRTLMFALVAAWIASAAILYLTRTVDLLAGRLKITGVAAGQLGVLLSLICVGIAVGFRLYAYELLFSRGPLLYGVGYTDANIRLLAINVGMVLSFAGALLVLVAAKTHSLKLAVAGLVTGIVVYAAIGAGVGAIVQRLVVNPDEYNKEVPYLARHIEATQLAYGLKGIKRTPMDVSGTLTSADLKNNEVTLKSIRLWDYIPLQDAYQQLQEIQQYYTFSEVDIDRYTIKGVYRQVMLAGRELDPDSLPDNAKTWVNVRLRYTHGYGLAMSPVNEVSDEGLPTFFLRNIPPVSPVGIEIKQPQIYFGEKTSSYVLVDTKVNEVDYPSAGGSVTTRYTADSGVKIGGVLRRSILATRFGDLNIALPGGNLTADSRILYRRNIIDRISTIAPFLKLDNDPYLVVSDGRLMWIQDAYTTTGRYPYSQPVYQGNPDQAFGVNPINYIRNSVKIVVDAYTGDVSFYVFDAADPVIRSFQKAFPGMFQPSSRMPDALKAHVRYPEGLFTIQANVFQTYHMSETQPFYNKVDVWAIPHLEQIDEQGGESSMPMEPYYVVMKLPGAVREECILLLPFRRANKENMVAWMAASCDQSNYGKLILYDFPKGEQFYGPAQVQARANQNTEISEQMTLWNQQKSNVRRGNLLVIPIEKSVLYVEPLYIQSINAKIPEFKRVIVSLGNEITMQPTLSEALRVLVGEGAPETGGLSGAKQEGVPGVLSTQAVLQQPEAPVQRKTWQKALDLYIQAESAQRRGDWANYGRRQKELGELLKDAAGANSAGKEE